MKKRSLKKNALLNAIRQITSVLFPLITVPYATRVLGVEHYGLVNFSASIINYFVLIAGLGISSYAVREGARVRNDQTKINQFASQMFTINVISTICSYACLIFFLVIWPQNHNLVLLLLVQSSQIIATTLGMDWVNNVYEDFFYITIRYIIFQCLALVGMFIFVHGPNDYLAYAFCMILSVVGGNLCNIAYIRKYVHVSLTKKIDMGRHLKPILVLFSNSVATILYITAGTTILGILMSNTEVGIYSVPVKIYTIIKNIINAVIMVTVPRVSFYIGQQHIKESKLLLDKTLNIIVVLVFPAMIGLAFLAEPIITIISGAEFSSGAVSLRLLCVALLFGNLACFFANAVLLPFKREKFFLQATCIAAICNVALNFMLIPLCGIKGPAIATIVSEFIVMVYSAFKAREVYIPSTFLKNLGQTSIGCVTICLICYVTRMLITKPFFDILISVTLSLIAYGLTMILMRNEIIRSLVRMIISVVRDK